MTRVAASVVAYNSGDRLPACIGALRDVVAASSIVIVDHGVDGSAELCEGLGALVLRDPSNPGFGAGQNHGVAATDADYVLLVNPDARVIGEGVRRGIEVLDREPDVAVVQGVVRGEGTGAAERTQGVVLGPIHLLGRAIGARRLLNFGFVRSLVRRSRGLRDHVERAPGELVDVASLAAVAPLVRRDAFDSIGGFDEGYFLYGEDLDLCTRLRAAGWRLVALPDEWALHASGASSASWWDRELVWWEGTMRYAATWWPRRAFAVGLLAVVVRVVPMVAARPQRLRELVARLVLTPWRLRKHR